MLTSLDSSPEPLSTASYLHGTHSCHVITDHGTWRVFHSHRDSLGRDRHRHRHKVWQAPILQEDLSQVPPQHLTCKGYKSALSPFCKGSGRAKLNTGRETKGQRGCSSDANLVCRRLRTSCFKCNRAAFIYPNSSSTRRDKYSKTISVRLLSRLLQGQQLSR